MNQNDDWNDKHDDDGAQKTDANIDTAIQSKHSSRTWAQYQGNIVLNAVA